MKPKDVCRFMASMYVNFSTSRFDELSRNLEVPEKPMAQMSKGQQQRLRLAATMSRDARLYLLDEPLAGIDLVSRELIVKNLVSNWKEDSTILISTHEIKEIEGFFDRGLYLRGGELVSDVIAESLREYNQSMTDHFIEINKAEANQ